MRVYDKLSIDIVTSNCKKNFKLKKIMIKSLDFFFLFMKKILVPENFLPLYNLLNFNCLSYEETKMYLYHFLQL